MNQVELGQQARSLESHEEFISLILNGYCGNHKDHIRERLVACIETQDEESETIYRAKLRAILDFEEFWNQYKSDAETAAEYIKAYEIAKESRPNE